MLITLVLAATLTPLADTPISAQAAMEAQTVCQQFVQVRLGAEVQPDKMTARPLPRKDAEWLVDGNVKGPEGPLLFACHLHQGKHWQLLNFSLWAPQPLKGA